MLLIEDPFGHIGKNEDYIQIRDKIEGLIRDRLSINRKVIITSRADVLLDVFEKKQIEDCKIQGNGWINTSISSKEEAKKIVEIFLDTPFEGGRHQRRIDKIPL